MLRFMLMCLVIPLDFVLWNLFLAPFHGFVSPKECIKDNWNEYKGRTGRIKWM